MTIRTCLSSSCVPWLFAGRLVQPPKDSTRRPKHHDRGGRAKRCYQIRIEVASNRKTGDLHDDCGQNANPSTTPRPAYRTNLSHSNFPISSCALTGAPALDGAVQKDAGNRNRDRGRHADPPRQADVSARQQDHQGNCAPEQRHQHRPSGQLASFCALAHVFRGYRGKPATEYTRTAVNEQ